MLPHMVKRKLVLNAVPAFFWLYLLGTVALVALSFAPSSIKTSYTWSGGLLELVLLAGLYSGSNLSRLVLVVIGFLAGVGSLALQSPTFDVIGCLWSALAVGVTCLLLTPSMRGFTKQRRLERRRRRVSADAEPRSF
jgi:hypothetical protein